ncbi:MAG: hypothetical protein ACYS8I_16905 [Planctomycetota bacterium]|jgi:hypothetical protein
MMSDPILPHKSSLTPVSAPKSSLLFEKERLLKEIQRLRAALEQIRNLRETAHDMGTARFIANQALEQNDGS